MSSMHASSMAACTCGCVWLQTRAAGGVHSRFPIKKFRFRYRNQSPAESDLSTFHDLPTLQGEYRIQYSSQNSSGAVFACISIHSAPPGSRGGYEYKDPMITCIASVGPFSDMTMHIPASPPSFRLYCDAELRRPQRTTKVRNRKITTIIWSSAKTRRVGV